jgi:hypothetical protein
MPAQPQDHRPKNGSHAEASTEPFTFDRDGQTFTLPDTFKAGMLRRFRRLDELDMAFSILEEVCDEDTLAALDDMPVQEFNDLMERWQKTIGATPGK